MNINSDNSEPVVKRTKSNNLEHDSCNTLEEENNIDKNSDCEGKADLTDNEEEGTSHLKDDDDDDSLFPFPPDGDITDMLDGVKYHGTFPTITERYFTAYYKLNVQCPGDDVCVLMHSNRICMLTLAPSHVAFQRGTEITKVDFKVSEKLNRLLNKVSGKSKHGAQPLQTNSNICIITCSDGKTYTIKCCIIGKLVEVNEALLQDPKLLSQPPHKGGYLAIVLPNIKLLDKMKQSLLTHEQYNLAISERDSLLKNNTKSVNDENQIMLSTSI